MSEQREKRVSLGYGRATLVGGGFTTPGPRPESTYRPRAGETRLSWPGLLSRIHLSGLPRALALVATIATLALALLALAGFPLSLGPAGDYRYLKSHNEQLLTFAGHPSFSAIVPKTREIWIAPDGSGRIRETAGSPIFLGERDRARWEARGSPDLLAHMVRNEDFGPGVESDWHVSRLPTNRHVLAAAIRLWASLGSGSGPPVNAGMFEISRGLLSQPGVSPRLAAALYQVVSKIDGVEPIGNVADRAGRPGVGVAMTTTYTGAKERRVLIFDRTTSALLGEETMLLERLESVDVEPPAVIGHTTYLSSGTVQVLP